MGVQRPVAWCLDRFVNLIEQAPTFIEPVLTQAQAGQAVDIRIAVLAWAGQCRDGFLEMVGRFLKLSDEVEQIPEIPEMRPTARCPPRFLRDRESSPRVLEAAPTLRAE